MDELRHAYEEDGNGERFEKEVLVLSSTATVVEKVILSEQIPSEFQTDAYHALLSACRKKQKFQAQKGEASTEMVKLLDESIRSELEPTFRRELETHLRKTFRQGPGQRRNAIRQQKRYQWMAVFYPAVFWTEYKVILLSVQKLMSRNITLVEHSFACLSNRMLSNRIVCIDEFDASKAVILDRLIDQSIKLQADYLQLFLQVYRGATTHTPSNELKQLQAKYDSSRSITWEKLLDQAKEIYQDGALEYSMKTVDSDIDKSRNFLFHDTSYHTVLDGNRTHIRAVRNDEQAQVQIYFETKDEYATHQDEPRIVLQNLLRRIHVFLLRFQRYVHDWAELFAKQVNANKKENEDLYTTAAAAESIFREYGLTVNQARLMAGEMEDSSTGRVAQKVVTPNLSVYETGFRLFEFIDDDHHRTQTYLQYLQMQNTPEKVLLHLCHCAKVVGLSATAALPTVLGNYDLKYLKEQLQYHYSELSASTKSKIRKELETLWSPYDEGLVRVDLNVVDHNRAHLLLSERLRELFASSKTARKYEQRLILMGISDYEQNRYCNIFTAMKAFWCHPEIRSFLCLNQVLPALGKFSMDEQLLTDVLEDLRLELAPQDSGKIAILRSGSQFEEDKETLLRMLQNGEKRFILSTYQTLGAGQNLQYPINDRRGLVLLKPDINKSDSRFRYKDIDALYLGDVTHVTVNLNEEGKLSKKDLIQFCFQAECLYQNDEISYRTLNSLLKNGIGWFSGKRRMDSSAQSALRQTASAHGQITRDIIQAVGRMNRTFLKQPVVYLFTTEKALSDLSPACLEDRLLSPEMQALKQARIELGQVATRVDIIRNEAERKATRGNTYIMRMLSSTWTADSMKLWKALRHTVLCHPRADTELWQLDPVIRTYYIPLAKEKTCYFYAQKGDFSEVTLSLEQDKAVFSASLPKGVFPSEVSEEESRLPLILSYPGMKEHFTSNGWATKFGEGVHILSPVLFQNIYKGALGEVAGSFILQHELGLSLHEIEDPNHFEYFDFVLDSGIYFDFKHWRSKTQMDQTVMRNKTLAKLNAVGGDRAFIVNLISDEISEPSCTYDERLIEIPGLLLSNGQINQDALNYMRRFLF